MNDELAAPHALLQSPFIIHNLSFIIHNSQFNYVINFKIVIRIIGILLLLETVMLLACSGVSFYYQDEALVDFWVSAGITAGAGLLLAAMGKGGDRQLTRRDGYVLVSFAWIAFSLFGMLPFYISGYIPSITNAFFETMSGFSSTGATILDDIESLPHGLSSGAV